MTAAFQRLLERRIAGSSRGPVMGAEMRRILALPKKSPDDPEAFSLWMGMLKKHNPKGRYKKLLLSQIDALIEMTKSPGFVGLMGVGSGKTLVSLLAPSFFNCWKPVVVVPAALKQRTIDEVLEVQKAWSSKDVTVLSWSDLSQAKNKDLLEDLAPDMFVFDEAHNLKNRKSARGGRIARYLKKHPCPVVALSGTMTRRSVSDVAWIFEAALGEGSPLPHAWSDIEDWAAATDDKPLVRYQPGALKHLMQPGETPRQAVWRKVAETPGILRASIAEEDLPSLTIRNIGEKAPKEILEKLHVLEQTWEIPGTDVILSDPAAVTRTAKQLSLGFYYEAVWAPGVLRSVQTEWMDARRQWSAFVRQQTKYQAHDSEALVKKACREGSLDDEPLLRWEEALAESFGPTSVGKFLPYFAYVVMIVEKWLKSVDKGIVWVESIAIGKELSKLGISYLGAGSTEKDVNNQDKAICSIKVCGTGMNLQKFSNNLVLEPPASGVEWEQLIGRTHRPGQKADEVSVDVLCWTEPLRKAWDSAIENAHYQEIASGSKQKLLLATKIGF